MINLDESFARHIGLLSGQSLAECYQCVKCSAGCPVASAMDILPHQIIRMVQYGIKETVLSSQTIWICASCYTCSVRCPNGIDIAHIMDVLRQISLAEGFPPGEKNVPEFHSAFLSSVKKTGRVYELGMLARYKFRTGTFMQDMKLGAKMFLKGKIKLLPHKIRRLGEVRRMFQAASNRESK
ncbi:MAG: 4Fe-4S dicluster domain-containing protein [Deltaproteobacteria bacterium]|nr:4Fe-4S dicluster domain-containing protein [Deltaproteobacteria bacterium]